MLAITGVTAGVNVYKSLTDKGPAKPALPPAPPVDTSVADASSAAAAGARARKAALVTSSRRDTLLTGPMGLAAPPPVTRKTLLGG